jgi:hypothetical protein
MEAHRYRSALARRIAAGIALALLPSLTGASFSYKTANFVVEATSADVARQVGDHAEACRVSIAKAWLGQELPPWKTPCPIKVKLTRGEAGGLTSFGFSRGKVSDQSMSVEGRLDRILASSLPHEVTHTIFAAYFGGPMPRWADEGASLLSEDLAEFRRHDQIVVDLMARRGNLALETLFRAEEYPDDLMGFYGQGYSVARFLVESGGRPRFLAFVREGSQTGWDEATRKHYGLAGSHELDRAWRSWHKVSVDNGNRSSTDGAILVQAKPRTETPGQ